MSNKIVLIGAGSAMFGLGSVGNIFKSKALQGSTVVLHDINPQALSKVERIARRYMEDNRFNIPWLRRLRGRKHCEGGFCILAGEIGNRYELWEQDWKIPLQYGIHQVYGENGGPGGLFHSLRIIPDFLRFAATFRNFVQKPICSISATL